MENAAKALGIAGGVLIALIILASLIYTFKRMSQIPEQQNYAKELAQITEFNEQFEAYQKNLMYGVDVVSCLNKVIDNNKKSEEYLDGKYNIEINITIKSSIEDYVEVYYYDAKGKERKLEKTENIGTFGEIFKDFKSSNISKIQSTTQVNPKPNEELKEIYTFIKINENEEKTYSYKKNSDLKNGKDAETLKFLSESTVNMKKVATNSNGNIQKWSKAIWYTSAYDFKNKKFKCSKITYDNEGRVNSISFEEIKQTTN